MKITKSKIDSDYKLVEYDNGVQYIVFHSASWLVGADDKTGTNLKDRFFQADDPEPNDRVRFEETIRGITNEGFENLKKSFKAWADRLPFDCSFQTNWSGEDGAACKAFGTICVPASPSKWESADNGEKVYKALKSLRRITNRVMRQYPLAK